MSSKWPPCSHIDFSRKYIVCIKHYFTTNYKLMISNHLQVTGGSYQNINMVAVVQYERVMPDNFVVEKIKNKVLMHEQFKMVEWQPY
jgi:hypothetical protein